MEALSTSTGRAHPDGSPPILVITGPTASGKTDVAIRCALALGAHIIGADSRQIYSRLRIGTARPDEAAMRGVPHHLVGTIDPGERYSAGRFLHDALAIIEDLNIRNIPVIICGGAGMYLTALVEGLFNAPAIPAQIRTALAEILARDGLRPLLDELAERDPETFAVIDRANPRRVLRALEVCRALGRPYSAVRRETFIRSPLRTWIAGLAWPRTQLYERIDERVDAMLAGGLLDEVRDLLRGGVPATAPAFDTVGYKEVLAHIRGDIDHETMRALIRQHTRNYAKRQLTWFRHQLPPHWYPITGSEELAHIHERILVDHAAQTPRDSTASAS